MNERELDHGVLVERIQTSKDNIYYLHRCQYKVGKYGKCNYHETTRQCIDDGEKYKCPLGCKSLVGKVLPIKKPTYEEKIASMGAGFERVFTFTVFGSLVFASKVTSLYLLFFR